MSLVVPLVATGMANTASVIAWLRRAGVASRVTTSPADVAEAPALVLPGVGAFGPAMASLASSGLVGPLAARIAAGRPTLAICLGMQILFERSEENPGARGLGIIAGAVRQLPPSVRVPHMGWNRVSSLSDAPGVIPDGSAYFANSFAATDAPDGWRASRTSHGVEFISGLEREGVVACQFHPELSGIYGQALLRRWLARAGSFREASSC